MDEAKKEDRWKKKITCREVEVGSKEKEHLKYKA